MSDVSNFTFNLKTSEIDINERHFAHNACTRVLSNILCILCQAAADALRLERQVLVEEKAKLQKALDTLEQEHANLQADLRRFQVS
jgi:hypothetical protein